MHRAKGLEFKVVFVINSEGEVPLSYAIKKVTDAQAKEEAIAREQQLLYVSMARARDEVFILWAGQPSRFLEKVMK